jgi:hypothetical protein
VQASGRAALTTVLGAGEATVALVRSGLTGLALWWQDHPDVTREEIVATALRVLWTGLEQAHSQREDDQRHPDEQREDDPDAECL